MRKNLRRFPVDFMFQLTGEEAKSLVSQNVIPSLRSLGGYLPYAFTQEGVAMLSSVLHSRRAVLVNIQIMRTFVSLRRIALTYTALKRDIERIEKKYDKQFAIVFQAIKQLLEPPLRKEKRINFGYVDSLRNWRFDNELAIKYYYKYFSRNHLNNIRLHILSIKFY